MTMSTKLGKEIGGITLNKEEILAKSRKENSGRDEYENKVIADGSRIALLAADVPVIVVLAVELIAHLRPSVGVLSIVFSMSAVLFWYKYAKLRKKHELFVALIYTVITLAGLALWIYQILEIGGTYGR